MRKTLATIATGLSLVFAKVPEIELPKGYDELVIGPNGEFVERTTIKYRPEASVSRIRSRNGIITRSYISLKA